MELAYRKLTADELATGLRELDGWSEEGDLISRQFEFKAYQEGLVFASAVGYLADHLDHHPDMTVGYKKVTVKVNTHSVNGLSPYDLELARRINQISG